MKHNKMGTPQIEQVQASSYEMKFFYYVYIMWKLELLKLQYKFFYPFIVLKVFFDEIFLF
jgi:hypothetical protein